MPFITEELWQHLRERGENESLMISRMPEAERIDEKLISTFEQVKEIIAGIRKVRQEKNIAQKNLLSAQLRSNRFKTGFEEVINKLAGLNSLTYVDNKAENAASFMVGTFEVYIPLEGLVDEEEERKKLQDELEYTKGFLANVMKKLGNEHFVKNAPANVVELEYKKQSDALAKIKTIEERLASL